MQKAQLLRTALETALPALRRDPSRLRMWIDQGSAQCANDGSLGFSFTFRLHVLVLDMQDDLAPLSLALFLWLRDQQPELLLPGATGFAFEADILDEKSYDIAIRLDLTQAVTATQDDAGAWTTAYVPEQVPLLDDLLGLGGATPIPPLSAIALEDEGIVTRDGLLEDQAGG